MVYHGIPYFQRVRLITQSIQGIHLIEGTSDGFLSSTFAPPLFHNAIESELFDGQMKKFGLSGVVVVE